MGKKGWLWGGGGLVVLIGGVGLAYANSDLGRADTSLEQEIEAARKLGMPLTPKDLEAQLAKRTTGSNAGDAYLNSFKMLPKGSLDHKAVKRLVVNTATPADMAALRTDLLALKPALVVYERGTEMDSLNYRRDWKQGISLLLPDLAYHRRLNNALVVRGVLAMQDGKRAEAEQSFLAAARGSRHLEFDPILISMLVRASEESTISRGLSRYLSRYPDAQGLAYARKVVSTLGPVPDFRHLVGAELMMGHISVSEIAKTGRQIFGENPDRTSDMVWNTLQFTPIRRANQSALIKHWCQVYESLPSDPANYAAVQKALTAAEERASGPTTPTSLFVKLLTPSLTEAGKAHSNFLTRRMTWDHVFDVIEARLTQRKLPATLEAEDIFQTPYVYKVNPNGFSLTSLGPNRKSDDKGDEDIGTKDDTTITIDFRRP